MRQKEVNAISFKKWFIILIIFLLTANILAILISHQYHNLTTDEKQQVTMIYNIVIFSVIIFTVTGLVIIGMLISTHYWSMHKK